MLDAVLNGDLDVVHIQPYFSTFVNLIQSGQVELERHQAERLLHKVLVTSSSSSSPTIKTEPGTNSNKRTRSDSHSRGKKNEYMNTIETYINDNLEHHSSSTSRHHHHHHHRSEEYRSSTEPNAKKHSSSSSSTRRVHVINENKTTNGK